MQNFLVIHICRFDKKNSLFRLNYFLLAPYSFLLKLNMPFQLEIPQLLLAPNVFSAWMALFLNLLERPVPLEGQPTDPDLRKAWGWWKVKKWTIHILNRLYTRSDAWLLNVRLNIVHLMLILTCEELIKGLGIWSFRSQRIKLLLKCFMIAVLEKFCNVTYNCSMLFVQAVIYLIGLLTLYFNISPAGLCRFTEAGCCLVNLFDCLFFFLWHVSTY